MTVNSNSINFFFQFLFRLRMQLMAFLLYWDYNHIQEFNVLDGEDFVDEYTFDAQNFSDRLS